MSLFRPALRLARQPRIFAKRPFSLSAFHLSKPYDFNSVSALTLSPSPSTILIDAREPSEYAEGHIPGAINIPVKSAPDALLLSAEDFEDRFGFAKPASDATTVFYCKAGVRSRAAAMIAEQAGYTDVGDYGGSWLDWEEQGGEIER